MTVDVLEKKNSVQILCDRAATVILGNRCQKPLSSGDAVVVLTVPQGVAYIYGKESLTRADRMSVIEVESAAYLMMLIQTIELDKFSFAGILEHICMNGMSKYSATNFRSALELIVLAESWAWGRPDGSDLVV